MNLRQAVPLLIGRATARLPPSVDTNFWRCLRLLKPVPLWKLSGLTQAGLPGTALVGGSDPLEVYLPHRFFVGPPTHCEALCKVSPFKLPGVLRARRPTTDLTVIQLDRIQARRLLRPEYLRVPVWVRSKFPIPDRIESLATGHNSLRQDLRLLRKYGYTYSESYNNEDLDAFYKAIYRPHGLGRYGPKAHLRSFRAIQDSFRRGVLLWILNDGVRVGGIIVELKGRIAVFAAIGAMNGDEGLLKKGILSAAYYFGIQFGIRKGCTEVDLGGTRPCLTDGLAIYKRKWGAKLDIQPIGSKECLVYWPKVGSSVLAMLNLTPLVTVQKGKLVVLQGDGAEPLSDRALGGVDRVVRVSSSGLTTPEISLAAHDIAVSD